MEVTERAIRLWWSLARRLTLAHVLVRQVLLGFCFVLVFVLVFVFVFVHPLL